VAYSQTSLPKVVSSVMIILINKIYHITFEMDCRAEAKQGKARQGNFIYVALFIHKAD
jgi:hypothetical protein